MRSRRLSEIAGGIGLSVVLMSAIPAGPAAQTPAPGQLEPASVTFTKHIAPILQRSCQQCHNPDGGAPMSLTTYEEVRPYARAIKQRTGLGPRAGVMPPWFVEKNIGIQRYKGDPSLSDDEIATIAKWADSGAPRGNPADMPPPTAHAEGEDGWLLGKPDLIVKGPEIVVPAVAPDKWGNVGSVPTGLTEDRWVKSVEVREINDIPRAEGTKTVGGRYVFHHMNYQSSVPGGASTSWPIHEIGRNPDEFPDTAGRLLAANSILELNASHVHANGHDTQLAPRVRLPVLPERLPADLPARGPDPRQRQRSRRQAEHARSGDSRVRDAAGAHQDRRLRAAPARARRPDVPRGDLGHEHPAAHLRGLRPQLGEAVHLRRRCGADSAEGHDPAPRGLPRHDEGEQEPGRRRATGRAAGAAPSRTCSSTSATRSR